MGAWREVELGELIELHDHRRVPLSRIVREQRQGVYRYFGAQGVIDHVDDYIFDGEYILVAEDGENLRSRKQPVASMVSGRFWVNNHAHIVKGRSGVADDRFLVHAINIAPLSGLISGAAQPKLTQANLRQLPLPCPNFPTQQRIGSFISAFDQLIGINERRIDLLRDLTRSLYREWFVRFRFPGHDDVDLVDSTLGPIPRGWDVRRLNDVASIVMGQSPKSEFYNDCGQGLPFHQGVSDYGPLIPTHRKFCVVEPRVAERDDVLCSVRAPVGRLNLADQRLVIGRGLSAIRRRDARVGLLLEQLRSALGDEDSLGGGTIFKAIGRDELSGLAVLEPPSDLGARFEAVVLPMLREQLALTFENRVLVSARDLLLPPLVTGRLDISEIDLGDLLASEVA